MLAAIRNWRERRKLSRGGWLPGGVIEAPARLLFKNGEKIWHADGTTSQVEFLEDGNVAIKRLEERWR